MSHRTEGGFTIAEIIIALALIGILALPIINNTFQFYVGVSLANRQANMHMESQAAIRLISNDLRMASGINAINAVADPNNVGGWTTSNIDHVLVIATPAQDSSGNFIINTATNLPYKNEIVYYPDSNFLYRRTLPASAPGNSMVRSCPPAVATSTCPADTILISKFSSSSHTFFDANDLQTQAPGSARSVKLTLQTEERIFGQVNSLSNTLQVTFRNK